MNALKITNHSYNLRSGRFRLTSPALTSMTQETTNFDWKRSRYRFAFQKLLNHPCRYTRKNWVNLYREPELSASGRSFLFRQAIQLGETFAAIDICGYGVPRPDLEFFVSYTIRFCQHHERTIASICKILRKSGSKEEHWLAQTVIRSAMKEYLKQKSSLTFKKFMSYFSECSDEKVAVHLFREAIAKFVDLGLVEGFVKLCKKQFASKTKQEDCTFAYRYALTASRADFMQKVLELKSRKQFGSVSLADVEELQILIQLVTEKDLCSILPYMMKIVSICWAEEYWFSILDGCVQKMLRDDALWPGLAPSLNKWLKKEWYRSMCMDRVRHAQRTVAGNNRSVSLSSLTQWCLDTGHASLAFFLAVVSEDWQVVETLVTTQASLDLYYNMLPLAVDLAAQSGKHGFSAVLAMLKLTSPDRECSTYHSILRPCFKNSLLVAKVCEEAGFLDWGLVIMASCHNWAYVEKHHRRCHSDVILKFILQETLNGNPQTVSTVSRELVPRCSDSHLLKHVLQIAVMAGDVTLTETAIGCVDPTTALECVYGKRKLLRTLLFKAVANACSSKVRLDMVYLCISSGVSTFERSLEFEEQHCGRFQFHPLLEALEQVNLPMVKALLRCGACSHRTLQKVQALIKSRSSRNLTDSKVRDSWKSARACVKAAASSPCRLEHLARLTASHHIGCQPGRSQRIEALPIPDLFKGMLRFEDVVFTAAEGNLE